ncbi:lectin BRA-3-like [Mizuhopecten yessoensis]|uniref:Lectin BRA-3 n=1 Tax=Mizuhopecten yessoensis TaxID=6573 RepID=A0A210PX81_MIZYE|nr:lectin BRA-3-like [Mizuhopecten yessoensis]OWF41108.1 Lectin BRA-3 [Mizuhopecten yessoensis]
MYIKECVILCVIVAVSLVHAECEHGWVEFKENCIHVNAQRTNWNSAEIECKKLHGWLASDDTQDKHDFLYIIANVLKTINIFPFFIGGTDFIFEGQYRWAETGQYAGPFTKWDTGFPNGNWSKNCLMLNWDGDDLVWQDERCSAGHYFICEKMSNVSQPIVGK